MQLCSNDLFMLCQCAISAAYQAGHLISEKAQQSVTVNTKNGGTSLAAQVVTEVDYLSQEVILQTLLPTCKLYELALLSEESPDNRERLEKDFFWSIDPLDGTLPFIESIPGYAVSIALVSRDGTPQIGVVFDPRKNTIYHAIKGSGAFINGQKLTLHASVTSTKNTLNFITDRSFVQDPLYNKVLPELERIAANSGYAGSTLQLQGGAAMNACQVLDKPPACYFKFPKPQEGGGSLWDYSATACLFHEAGTPVSDIYGDPLELNRLDSTFMNHRGVLYSSNLNIAAQMISLYGKYN